MSNISVNSIPLNGWNLMSQLFPAQDNSSKIATTSMSQSGPNFTQSDVERELETHYPVVFSMVSAMVWGTGLDPEDLTQDVFLKAYRKADSFNQESLLSTWLYRIARNTVIDAQRKRKFRNFFTGFSINNDENGIEPANPESVHDEVESNEIVHVVRTSIASLPEPFKSIIVWREIEELPYAQISEITGESEGTLKSRLFHAKKKLKDILVSKGLNYDLD
ncbi:MAG TPA: hypothetical protein DCE78_07075 [Bacteroidetes bacterium]|nr:hypothetical protein [Bacteroidota bacterium]